MKKLIASFILAFTAFSIIYLSGSFYSATFDISKWESGARGICSFFGVIAFVAGFAFTYNYFDDHVKNKF